MAQNITNATSEEGGRTYANVAELKAQLQKHVKAVAAENAAIQEIKESQIQDHRDVIKDIKAKVKKDLKISMKAFNAAVTLFELEQRAINNTDEEAGDDLQDSLRLTFAALREGQMLNFLDVIEPAAGGNGSDDDDSDASAQEETEEETAGSAAVH